MPKNKFDNSILYISFELLLIVYCLFKGFNNGGFIVLMLSEILLLIITLMNREKLQSFFSPLSIFLIACHVSFSLKGINILLISKFNVQDFEKAMWWYILFLLGVLLSLKLKIRKKILSGYYKIEKKEIDFKYLKTFILVFIPFSLLLYFKMLGTTNILVIFNNLLKNRVIFQNNGGLYMQTIIFLPLKILVYVSYILLIRKVKSNKFEFIILFILLEVIAFSLGGRGEIIFPILALMFINEKNKKIISLKKIAILASIFLVFSGWYGLLRDGQDVSNLELNDTVQNVLDRYVQLDNLIRFTKSPVDIKVGQSFLDFVTSPIPRNIYPKKAYPFNSQMTSIYLPEQFNRKIVSDFTTISELYYNFGYIGIFIGGIIFGLILNYISYLFTNDKSIFFQIFYPFMMLKPMSIFYGGMINSNANMMLILEIVLIITVWNLITSKSMVEGEVSK